MFRRRQPSPDKSRARPDNVPPDNHSDQNADEQERLILSALEELRDTSVREVMTPRVDVVGLPIPVHAPDVAKAVRESGHGVFPVYDEDLDRLVGVLYVEDLLRSGWEIDGRNGQEDRGPVRPSPLEISRRIRQPYLVPESLLVLNVLADMRRDRRSFAVVVDEYGGMAGVLTVRDLLSALVGDLRDEFDQAEEPDIIRVDRTRWLVDGSTSVDDVREQLGFDVPEGEYVTLGGFLFDAFGHIPQEGEQLTHNGWELRVAEMDRRRVAKVVVKALDQDTVTEPDDAQPESQ